MSPLSDDYIRGLEPETLRYDVTIFDDFVISVLPNGIKTWAFLYDYEGRKRRKTLGVYPDMTYEQAEDALDNVRGMISKLGDDIKDSPVEESTPTHALPELPELPDEVEDVPIIVAPPPPPTAMQRPAVLASRTRYRQHRSRTRKLPKNWIRPFALGLALVVGLGALVFVLPKLDLFGGSTDSKTTRPTASDRAAAQPIVIEDPAPGADPTDESTGTDAAPLTPAPPDPNPEPETPPEPSAEVITTEPEPVMQRAPDPAPIAIAAQPEPEPEPPEILAAPIVTATETVSTRVVDAPSETNPETPALIVTVDPQTDLPPTIEVPLEAPIEQAPVSAPTTPLVQDTERQTTDPPKGATSTGGLVSRAVVSSNVRDLEPVDDLGQNVVLTNSGYQTVFYFTELRNFTAGNIVHRWTVNGKVIADVPLRVGGGWRWRTYSSKDLLPGMTGEWSVAVVDGNGNVMGERSFQFDR